MASLESSGHGRLMSNEATLVRLRSQSCAMLAKTSNSAVEAIVFRCSNSSLVNEARKPRRNSG